MTLRCVDRLNVFKHCVCKADRTAQCRAPIVWNALWSKSAFESESSYTQSAVPDTWQVDGRVGNLCKSVRELEILRLNWAQDSACCFVCT